MTIDKHRFYERLVESRRLPTTSQASPAAFDAIFSDVASVGDNAVVVDARVEVLRHVSGACIAAAEYDNIYVVDSKSAAIGSGILASTRSSARTRAWTRRPSPKRWRKSATKFASSRCSTAGRLKKGGRISKTVAFAGGLLNIETGHHRGRRRNSGYRQGERVEAGQQPARAENPRGGGIDFDEPIILGYSGLSDSYLKNMSRTTTTSGRTRRTRSTPRSFAA